MSSQTPIKVMCIDDNAEVLAALRVLISRTPGLACVGTLRSAEHLADQAARARADVVLLDIGIPGSDVLQELHALSASGSPAKTIVFSGNDQDDTMQRARDAGAAACVGKCNDPQVLVDTIRAVAGLTKA